MQKHIKVKFIIVPLFYWLLLSHNLALAQQDPLGPKNLSIVVSSCDKYSGLWTPFFGALIKNWPELDSTHKDLKIYLVANSKQYSSARVETINIPNEISWSDNMLAVLDQIDSKYILLFLDDYWVDKTVDQARLAELINTMEQEDAAYMQLFGDGEHIVAANAVKNIAGVCYKNKFQNYRASLQLALWETKALKQILRSGESAWTFEIASSIRSSGYPKPFLSLRANLPITYINASYQGHIQPDAVVFAQQNGFDFINTMPVLGSFNWRLRLRAIQHKITNFIALVKRNILLNEQNSYRYIFEDKS